MPVPSICATFNCAPGRTSKPQTLLRCSYKVLLSLKMLHKLSLSQLQNYLAAEAATETSTKAVSIDIWINTPLCAGALECKRFLNLSCNGKRPWGRLTPVKPEHPADYNAPGCRSKSR